MDFMLKDNYNFLLLLKQYTQETIYIKVVFYVFYKHDVLFLIFNLNTFYVLAGKAMKYVEFDFS